MTSTQELRKPVFVKVKDLEKTRSGYNVIVKVISTEVKEIETKTGHKIKMIDAVVGDETGVAKAFFKGENANLIEKGKVVAIRNGVKKFIKNFISLELDIFGRVTSEKADITVDQSFNISQQQHKLPQRPKGQGRRDNRRNNRGDNRRGDNRRGDNRRPQRRDDREDDRRQDRREDDRRGEKRGPREPRAERTEDRRDNQRVDNRRDAPTEQRRYNNDRPPRRNDDRQGQRQPEQRRDNRSNNYNRQNRDNRDNRNDNRPARREYDRDFDRKREDDRPRQQQQRYVPREQFRDKRTPPIQWTKIEQISPGEDRLNFIAQVLNVQAVDGKRKMLRVVLGDQTGLVKAFLEDLPHIAVGKSVALFGAESKVVKEHIQIQIRGGRVEASRRQVTKVNKDFNLSDKAWIPAEQ